MIPRAKTLDISKTSNRGRTSKYGEESMGTWIATPGSIVHRQRPFDGGGGDGGGGEGVDERPPPLCPAGPAAEPSASTSLRRRSWRARTRSSVRRSFRHRQVRYAPMPPYTKMYDAHTYGYVSACSLILNHWSSNFPLHPTVGSLSFPSPSSPAIGPPFRRRVRGWF